MVEGSAEPGSQRDKSPSMLVTWGEATERARKKGELLLVKTGWFLGEGWDLLVFWGEGRKIRKVLGVSWWSEVLGCPSVATTWLPRLFWPFLVES